MPRARKSFIGGWEVEFDFSTMTELWEKAAAYDELSKYGHCDVKGEETDDVRFSVREHEGNKYYELRSNESRAQMAFGQHKKGETLFPKKQEDGSTWFVWGGNGNGK